MRDEEIGTEDVQVEALDTPTEVVDYSELKFDESEAVERPGSVCNVSAL